MNIIKEKNGEKGLIIKPVGRIDVETAAKFEHDVKEELLLDNVTDFVLDLGKTDYISSIGLRAILEFQKTMNNKGTMTVQNVSPEILELFQIVGFDKIINIV